MEAMMSWEVSSRIQDWPYRQEPRAWGDSALVAIPLEDDQVEIERDQYLAQLVDRLEFMAVRDGLDQAGGQGLVDQYLPELAPRFQANNLYHLMMYLVESDPVQVRIDGLLPSFPVQLGDQNNVEAVEQIKEMNLAEWIVEMV